MSSRTSPLLYDAQGMPVSGAPVILPVWLYPSIDSEAFDFASYVALPAIAAQAVVVSFVVPAGRNGIIARIGNVFVGGGFQEGAGSVQWQLLADTVAIPNYDNIVASLGTTAAPSTVSSIRVKENQNIQLVINNIALVVAGQLSGGRLGGWFYPIEEEPEGST